MIHRIFRKYHRSLAVILMLPLLITTITGSIFPIARALHQRNLAEFLIHIHTLKIFGLEDIFPILNGIGLLGLLITGIYMTSLFRQRRHTA